MADMIIERYKDGSKIVSECTMKPIGRPESQSEFVSRWYKRTPRTRCRCTFWPYNFSRTDAVGGQSKETRVRGNKWMQLPQIECPFCACVYSLILLRAIRSKTDICVISNQISAFIQTFKTKKSYYYYYNFLFSKVGEKQCGLLKDRCMSLFRIHDRILNYFLGDWKTRLRYSANLHGLSTSLTNGCDNTGHWLLLYTSLLESCELVLDQREWKCVHINIRQMPS